MTDILADLVLEDLPVQKGRKGCPVLVNGSYERQVKGRAAGWI